MSSRYASDCFMLAAAQLASGAACRAATLLLSKLLPALVALLGVMRERYMSMSSRYAKDRFISCFRLRHISRYK